MLVRAGISLGVARRTHRSDSARHQFVDADVPGVATSARRWSPQDNRASCELGQWAVCRACFIYTQG